MADAAGLAAELDELPAVDDAVDRGGGHSIVPEHRPPHLLSPQVRGDRRRPPLVGVGKGLEERLRPVRVEREKPELVDDERASLADERGHPAGLPVVAGAPQAHHEPGRREEARFEASRPGLSASRWPARYSTCFGAPSPGRSSRTAVVGERDFPASAI